MHISKDLPPATLALLDRAAKLIDPGPVPPDLADLIDGRSNRAAMQDRQAQHQKMGGDHAE